MERETTNSYAGFSYEQASREGLRLIQRAADTGSWFALPEKLAELRGLMERRAVTQLEQRARARAEAGR